MQEPNSSVQVSNIHVIQEIYTHLGRVGHIGKARLLTMEKKGCFLLILLVRR
jgi:hypothetical protein